jgi:phosphatidylethanolamine/phosphatidyl-N-methylethanolamine N-methyltransferase
MLQLERKCVPDHLRFLRALATSPKSVGAIAPSSAALARAIAAQIGMDGEVLELGPGTGVVTQALLARGLAPGRLTLIEHDPQLAELNAARFPGTRVINGDAFQLDRILGHARAFSGIVSGLPLLNFPVPARAGLIDAIFARLAPGAPFVQFSYGLHPPVAPPANAFVRRAAAVWLNLPPARVWVYRKV